jgi:hypothetical protein
MILKFCFTTCFDLLHKFCLDVAAIGWICFSSCFFLLLGTVLQVPAFVALGLFICYCSFD